MRRRKDDKGRVKVKLDRNPDGDHTNYAIVELGHGASVRAARAPLWLSEGLATEAVVGGVRWQANADRAMLCFDTGGGGANVVEIDTSESPFVVAAERLVMWEDHVRLQPFEDWRLDGFLRAEDGRVWLAAPGYGWHTLSPERRSLSVLVDPTRVVWAKLVPAVPSLVTGPQGEQRLRFEEAAEALIHSWER